ncbi:MAG: hypothetical protein KME29_27835 [Calothrix sp. FI2-JRJ7]|jgi:hypothetical protein|nr:hypothetical protein [Calothrix sp. FI2-JRJ7]
MPRKIQLMADYGCDPLWWNDEEVGDIDPEDLPLSNDTIERLHRWAYAYDATLNWEDPADSPGFPSLEAKAAFEEEGISLWKQLQKELAPDYEVVYFSNRLRKTVVNLTDLEALR